MKAWVPLVMLALAVSMAGAQEIQFSGQPYVTAHMYEYTLFTPESRQQRIDRSVFINLDRKMTVVETSIRGGFHNHAKAPSDVRTTLVARREWDELQAAISDALVGRIFDGSCSIHQTGMSGRMEILWYGERGRRTRLTIVSGPYERTNCWSPILRYKQAIEATYSRP